MNTFKDCANLDISTVFFNINEFSELKSVNGKLINVVLEENTSEEHKEQYRAQGLYNLDLTMYVREKEFVNRPKINSLINIESKSYTVKSCREESGIYVIEMRCNSI